MAAASSSSSWAGPRRSRRTARRTPAPAGPRRSWPARRPSRTPRRRRSAASPAATGAAQRGVGAALAHQAGVHVGPVRGVQRHGASLAGTDGRPAAAMGHNGARDSRGDHRRRTRRLRGGAGRAPSSAPRSPSWTATGSAGRRCSPTACPSKTLIATAEVMTPTEVRRRARHHLRREPRRRPDRRRTRRRPRPRSTTGCSTLAAGPVRRHRAAGWTREGVQVVAGRGRLDGPQRVVATTDEGERELDADVVLVATGAAPRTSDSRAARRRADPHLGAGLRPRPSCPSTWSWSGSGVTGAEFAGAYHALGHRGDPGQQPRPGAAGRGRRRRRGPRAGLRPPRHDGAARSRAWPRSSATATG